MSNNLDNYKIKINRLDDKNNIERNLYLKKISNGTLFGPLTGYPMIDRPWLKYYSDEAIISSMPNVNLYQLMKMNNKDNLKNNALDYYGNKINYYELLENIDKVSKAFTSHGIKEGDVVSLCMPNIPETIYAFYALNKIGAVCNMIDLRTNEENIKKYINSTSSKMVICVDKIMNKIENLYSELSCKKIVFVSPSESLPILKKEVYNLKNNYKNNKFISWSEFMQSSKDIKVINSENKKGMPAVIIYTGGTTGDPKGAVLSNDALTSMYIEQRYANPKMEKNDTLLGIMPPFIAYGVVYGINGPLTTGMEIKLIPNFNIDSFPKLVCDLKPNHVIGVPSMWEELLKRYENTNIDLSFLKSAIAGGAPISVETYNKISKFLQNHGMNDNLRIGYGQTEASSSTTYMVDKENFIPTTVGIPLVKNTITIIDPVTNEEMTYNKEGEVVVNGPTFMNEYINMKDETSEVLKENNGKKWLYTKDIGYIDHNGMLYLSGRSKDIIFRPDGHNTYPLKIEKVLSTHKAVKDVLVVGAKCKETNSGFIPVAYITLHDEYKDMEEEILEEIKKINKKMLPERDGAIKFYVIDEMPLTNIGKPDRKYLENESKKLKLSRNLIY